MSVAITTKPSSCWRIVRDFCICTIYIAVTRIIRLQMSAPIRPKIIPAYSILSASNIKGMAASYNNCDIAMIITHLRNKFTFSVPLRHMKIISRRVTRLASALMAALIRSTCVAALRSASLSCNWRCRHGSIVPSRGKCMVHISVEFY